MGPGELVEEAALQVQQAPAEALQPRRDVVPSACLKERQALGWSRVWGWASLTARGPRV